MRIYWTCRSIPDYRALPRDIRGRIWRRCYRKSLLHVETWLALAFLGILTALGMLYFGIWGGGIGAALGGFVVGQVACHVAIRNLRTDPDAHPPSDPSDS